MDNKLFGAHYFSLDQPQTFEVDHQQLYFFRTFIGNHDIKVELGDCIYYFDEHLERAEIKKGPCTVSTKHLATVIRGYMHPDASASLEGVTTLPYVNGCSTKQVFPPLRPGDPTLQYLKMPPCSKEQEHHIHSTFRVVLVLKGKGKSIVGMGSGNIETELVPGSVCILEPMCPHHFETYPGEHLEAVPLHIFTSIGAGEKNHPMFNGTVAI